MEPMETTWSAPAVTHGGLAGPGRRVSPAGYWIGGLVLVVGVGAAVVWFVASVVGLITAPDDFQRVAVPGRAAVTLGEGRWVVYSEGPAGTDWPSNADRNAFERVTGTAPTVRVSDPLGRALPMVGTDFESYEWSGRQGQAIYEFEVADAGIYTVETFTEPSVRGDARDVAIGRPLFGAGLFVGLAGAALVALVSATVGVTLIGVTAARRSSAKRGHP
jgi:hypothetical protein